MEVLVTGAGGFVGRALCARLAARGHAVRRAFRHAPPPPAAGMEDVAVGEVDGATDWSGALAGVEAVIHLAARVHHPGERGADAARAHLRTNAEGTAALAAQAARASVRRLVFVSSIKVNGEATGGTPFGPASEPGPVTPYGASKWKAEQALWDVARKTGMEAVVVRPPLVYGAGVKANFRSLMELVDRGVPLPLRAVRNRRSMIYVGNLADLLGRVVESGAAPGRTQLASDGAPLSTEALVRGMASALGRPARLFRVPAAVLRAAARIAGGRAAVERLLGDLEVDDHATRRVLGWEAPYTLDDGLAHTAAWFRAGVPA